MTFDELLLMNDQQFFAFASRELKVTDPTRLNPVEAEEYALLREPEVIDRWYWFLRRRQKSIESQLGAKGEDVQALKRIYDARQTPEAREAWLLADAEFRRWRGGALRFKAGVEERMLDVDYLRTKRAPNLIESTAVLERDLALQTARRYRDAIEAHRKHECDDACEPECVADDELWRVL